MASSHAEESRPIAEISQGPSAFESFLDRNQKGLIVLGIALVLGAGAWVIMRGVKHSAARHAGSEFADAAGLAELQDVLKKHPGTSAAGSARILISEEQWKNGQQDAAIDTLRAFLAEEPEHPAAPAAKASLASRLMQQGKNDEAETLFRQISEDPAARYLAPFALISLGDLAKAAGRLDDAGELYEKARNDYAANPFANSAQLHLDLLKFKLPAEVEPPPPAEEPKEAPVPEESSATTPGLEGNPLGDILNIAPVEESAPAEDAPAENAPAEQETPAEPAEGD